MRLSTRKKTHPRALGLPGQVKSCPESPCCATIEDLCHGPMNGVSQKRLISSKQEAGPVPGGREKLGRNKQGESNVSGWKDPRE